MHVVYIKDAIGVLYNENEKKISDRIEIYYKPKNVIMEESEDH